MRTMQTLGPVIGVNHLYAQQQLSDASSRSVVAPNVDTLYDVTVLDLRNGPVVLTVPEIHDRYYSFQFVAMNTEVLRVCRHPRHRGRGRVLGDRAAGLGRGLCLLADHLISAPTPLVFLLGRFLVLSADDLPTARAVMAQVRLEPLTPQSGEAASAASAARHSSRHPAERRGRRRGLLRRIGRRAGSQPRRRAKWTVRRWRGSQRSASAPAATPRPMRTSDARAALAKGVADGAARVKQELTSSTDSVNGWRQPSASRAVRRRLPPACCHRPGGLGRQRPGGSGLRDVNAGRQRGGLLGRPRLRLALRCGSTPTRESVLVPHPVRTRHVPV